MAYPSMLPTALDWAGHGAIAHDTAWWAAWSADPLFLVPIVLVALCYARGLQGWSERSREHSKWRTASYYSGLAVLVLAYQSPLDRLGEHQFSMHMVQHNIVMMLVPPLILLGAPTTPMLRGMPRWLRQHVVRPIAGNRAAYWAYRLLTFPVVAIGLFAASQWFWHLYPGLFDRALNEDWLHNVQHLSFLAVAMLFWWNIIDPKPLHSRIPPLMRIIYFYGAMIPKHVLSAFIVFADEPFYPTYERVYRFLPGSPLEDQQLAGLLMWVPFGELLNLITAGIILGFWFKRGNEEQRAREAAEDARAEAARAVSASPSTTG